MAKRLQSPSSINVFKQCPRRYYYQYIKKLRTKPSIHLARGSAVHEALEKFFDMDPSVIPDDFRKPLAHRLLELFNEAWTSRKTELSKLGLLPEQLEFYKQESTTMLANWLNDFFNKLDLSRGFDQAFMKAKPVEIEKEYRSQGMQVRGFVDAIEEDEEGITIIDYKTSKKSDITPEYRLQLGIYAALYQEQHGHPPKKVGIWFLKDRKKTFEVDEKLIKDAIFEVEQIHFATETDSIMDYRKKPGPLCKYRSGQCDFYDVCRPDLDR